MIDNLKRFFSYQSYLVMNTNLANVSVFYKSEGTEVRVVVFSDLTEGIELTKEQYNHILHQIEQVFYRREYKNVALLSLLATRNIDHLREFCETDQFVHWIVDIEQNRLVIYENQPAEFYDLRAQLESILIGKLHVINTDYEHGENPARKEKRLSHQAKGKTLKQRFRSVTYNKPFWTVFLIVINTILYIAVSSTASGFGISSQHLCDWGANEYSRVVEHGELYRLFRAMFLHASFEHLINNMFVLLMIGERLERLLGGFRFMVVYILSGIMASIGSLVYYHMQGILVVGVGASGAIFGVVGGIAYLVIRYRGRGLDITPNRLILFVIISLYSGFRSAGQVDNAAHVVGFIAGIVITMLIDNYRNRKRTRWYK